MIKVPTSDQARESVNIFASIDVLGILSDTDYLSTINKKITIEDGIKNFYKDLAGPNDSLLNLAMKEDLQAWDSEKKRYIYSGIWDAVIKRYKGRHRVFSNTSETKKILNKYVRLIASNGSTQGWKLEIDGSDLTQTTPAYLKTAYNLSVKAYKGQWLRWWGNSITPFSSLQCVIGNITNLNRPSGLNEIENQQDISVVYRYPSGVLNKNEYNTADSLAFSRMAQLKNTSDINVGDKIQYDILFDLVDPQGDVIASFQVDPEIIVVSKPSP